MVYVRCFGAGAGDLDGCSRRALIHSDVHHEAYSGDRIQCIKLCHGAQVPSGKLSGELSGMPGPSRLASTNGGACQDDTANARPVDIPVKSSSAVAAHSQGCVTQPSSSVPLEGKKPWRDTQQDESERNSREDNEMRALRRWQREQAEREEQEERQRAEKQAERERVEMATQMQAYAAEEPSQLAERLEGGLLHARVGALTVLQLGRIRTDHEAFHSETAIYPPGYHATRLFFAPGRLAVKGGPQRPRALYTCHISCKEEDSPDGPKVTPLFSVSVHGVTHYGLSATEACMCTPLMQSFVWPFLLR